MPMFMLARFEQSSYKYFPNRCINRLASVSMRREDKNRLIIGSMRHDFKNRLAIVSVRCDTKKSWAV